MRELLTETFFAALKATHPRILVKKHLPLESPSFILAIGKAALPMLEAAREVYPEVPFLAVPPNGENVQLEHGEIVFGTHPLPGLKSVQAANKAVDLLSRLSATDNVLMLISGGSSAIFSLPWGVSLDQKKQITQDLIRAGATINELNTVRKHLSRVKGGQLAMVSKAKVTALILSDVVGDDPSVIASGLTVPDPSTFAEALGVLRKYNIKAPDAEHHFRRGIANELPETPKHLDSRVQNTIIGSNFLLLNAAKMFLLSKGIQSLILSDQFTGETRDLAGFHAAIVQSIRLHQQPCSAPIMLISGGEATVTVKGHGQGGRNQEFMLWLLQNLGEKGVFALSSGSDGIDGNSSAAGAFLSPDSFARAKASQLEVQHYLDNNDSASFFAQLEDQFLTGATGHNLNDLRLIFVES
jgi:glycerate 2-kinase